VAEIRLGEAAQRLFYGLDEGTISTLVRTLVEEELSVVDGGLLERFERAAADFYGAKHAVATCNGTASIHLALFAIDLKPGDEVVMPTYGYFAMAVPVLMMGAKPVFTDVTEASLTIDPADAARMITPKTRAIIVHQPYGIPADFDALRALADEHGLALISDASHAHGATWRGEPVGRVTDFLCASFGKAKLVTGGELGIVTANEDRHRDRMLLYGHVNRVPKALITNEYRHVENAVGMKYRPHTFATAIALSQFETLAERTAKLAANCRAFEAGLAEIRGFAPYVTPEGGERVYWRVPVRVDRDRFPDLMGLVERLKAAGVPAEKRNPKLVHRHNVISDYYGVETDRAFPVAERMIAETIQVDSFPLYQDGAAGAFLEGFREVAND
jgi:dTDP-4-amino-4,6-dideoxygalactose transaminase